MGQFMHKVNIHVKHKNSRGGFAAPHQMSQYANMNISRIRKRRGLTQVDLAEMTKLTQPTISRAERGDDSTTMATFASIAAALEVPLAELFIDDRTAVEAELLQAFRRLPIDRQRGWIDMARIAANDPQEPSE